MALPSQLRAGRSLLGLTQAEIAARTHVSVPTVKRAESDVSSVLVSADAVAAIRHVLEKAGVIFTNDSAPRVKLRKRK